MQEATVILVLPTADQFNILTERLIDQVITVRLFGARSRTITRRILSAIELAAPAMNDTSETNNMVLLLVLVEQVSEYLATLQNVTLATVQYLLQNGADEETFSKWNERLEFIAIALKINAISFDRELDKINLRTDITHLKANIPKFTSNLEFSDALYMLLSKQENESYKTVIVPRYLGLDKFRR